jgi:hypothetical protein
MRSSWGILVSRFLVPLSPAPPSPNGARVELRRRPVEAAAPAAGMDAPSKSFTAAARPHPLGKRDAFSTVAWTRPSKPSAGARVHKLPQAPLQGYFLDGSTISPRVTFLDGLTGEARLA